MADVWARTVDDVTAVEFERVGDVVVAQAEDDLDAFVEDAVQDACEPRVINDGRLRMKARAEDAVDIACDEFAVVANEIFGTVRCIGHVNRDNVAFEAIETKAHGITETAE